MKIKIVNKNKFIRTCVIIFISVICMIFFGFNNAYSKENIKYKEQYIYQGDTLWSIAQKESKCNQYYKNKDIRNIVIELREINNIENSNLEIGEIILIPTF